MTTAEPGTFTSSAVARPTGVPLKFDGVRISADPDDPTKPIAEHAGYWVEKFTTIRVLPGAVLDRVSGSVQATADGEITAINQAAAIPILRELLDDESRPRFDRLIRDRDRVVDLSTLWQAAMYAVKELTELPTGGSGT